MRKKDKTRVIWIHPQGRFELRETEHYSLFEGRTYQTANAYLRRRTMRAGCAARCRQAFLCRHRLRRRKACRVWSTSRT